VSLALLAATVLGPGHSQCASSVTASAVRQCHCLATTGTYVWHGSQLEEQQPQTEGLESDAEPCSRRRDFRAGRGGFSAVPVRYECGCDGNSDYSLAIMCCDSVDRHGVACCVALPVPMGITCQITLT
jgi:hypothetical protein